MDSTLQYLIQDFWDENGDPFTSQFPGMGTPWPFFALGLNLILFCKIMGPKLVDNSKPSDLRPLMIICNGLAFGAYTAGVLVGVYVTNYFRDCMDCHAYDPTSDDLKHISMKYLGYVMVWTKIFDFLRPILCILSKKKERVTNLQLTHLQVSLLLVWGGVKLNPGGIFILLAITDTIYQVLVYGYLVMAASSHEMKPSPSFRTKLLYFREISIIVTFIHGVYFLGDTTCTGSYPMHVVTTFYTAFHIIAYPIDFYNRSKTRSISESNLSKKDDTLLDRNENAVSN